MAAKQSRSARARTPSAPVAPPSPLPLAVADAAIAIVALVSIVLLWREASTAWLTSDECFHAHVARWIADHRTLPRVIPELYSGMPYFYPPLFHVVAAAAVAAAGMGSLPYLNLVLTAVLFAALFLVPVPGVTGVARRWTVAALVVIPSLGLHAVRLYAEVLATLLAVAAILLLLALRAGPRLGLAIALGVVTGLALLAKQPMVLLPALLAMLAGVFGFRGERKLAGLLVLAAGLGVLIALPFFVRNALLFGGPFYPPVTTEAQRALDALNTELFSPSPLDFFRSAYRHAGPVVPWLVALPAAWAALRGPRDLRLGLIGLIAAFIVAAPWIARFEARHLNPFLAAAVLLALAILADLLRGRRIAQLAVAAALIAAAAVMVASPRDYRGFINRPDPIREAVAAIGAQVPPGERVLSVWTYETLYHAGRPATWPIPWSPSADLLPLFTTPDRGVFLATLDRQGVGWLLVPRTIPPDRFDGANYPASFVRNFTELVEAGELEVVWMSEHSGIARRRAAPPESAR